MKPSFTLKWLFVGIAVLALICGWVVDHRRQSAEQRRLAYELEDAEVTSLKFLYQGL